MDCKIFRIKWIIRFLEYLKYITHKMYRGSFIGINNFYKQGRYFPARIGIRGKILLTQLLLQEALSVRLRNSSLQEQWMLYRVQVIKKKHSFLCNYKLF